MPPPPRRRLGTRADRLAESRASVVREWIPADRGAVDAAQDPTVVKVPLGRDQRRRATAEAAALGSLRHPHVVPLRGLDDDGETLGILLPRLSTTSAADWLAARGSLPAGEAVTLLVPLLRALAHTARRRLDGGRRGDVRTVDVTAGIALDNVLFDLRGSPLLVGLRAGATRGPSLLHQPAGGVAAAALRLVEPVLGVLRDADPEAEAALRLAVDAARRVDRAPRDVVDELIEAVFALADPVPLTGIEFGSGPGRGSIGVVLASVAEAGPGTPASAAPTPALVVLRGHLSRLAAPLREVRRRTWLVAGILAASAVAAVVVIPASPETTDATATSPSQRPTASTPSLRTTPAPTGSPSAVRPGSAESRRILAGDDSATAAALLLALRARCLDEGDDVGLTEVEEADSPILRHDEAAVAAVDGGAAVDGRAGDETLPRTLTLGPLVDTLGGAVLFAATGPDDEPASVLISRSEAGWRLRSISREVPPR